MISCDTNVFMYYLNQDCAEHSAAKEFIDQHWKDHEFAVCELVLVETYLLLRNPAVLSAPLSAPEAVKKVLEFRTNPAWMVIDYPGDLMDKVWAVAEEKDFARRSIIDARLAYTLLRFGVSEFVTRNTKDFKRFSFKRLVSLW